jgi:hypothetical protein
VAGTPLGLKDNRWDEAENLFVRFYPVVLNAGVETVGIYLTMALAMLAMPRTKWGPIYHIYFPTLKKSPGAAPPQFCVHF